MRVKNINGISAKRCPCGSWLQHWVNNSGQLLPRYCAEAACVRSPSIGAHVQKDIAGDDHWYIVPLCATHNAMTGKSIEVSTYVTFVSANVSETCGKRFPWPS